MVLPALHSAVSRRLLILAACLAIFATVASYLGDVSWALGLAEHFRPHLALVSAGVLLVALIGRNWLIAAAGLALVFVNGAPLAPYVGHGKGAAAETGKALRVVAFNLHGPNTDTAALKAFVERTRPDVLLLTELPREAHAVFDALEPILPHRIEDGRRSPFDVALLSRLRPVQWRFDRSVSPLFPVISAELCDDRSPEVAAGCIRIVGLHGARPFGSGRDLQRKQFAVAAAMAMERPARPVVLLGDLNVTQWGAAFSDLSDRAGLRDSAAGRGFGSTWLSRWPLLGLRIDHVLIGRRFAVADHNVGPDLGSDHLPVIVNLWWQEPRALAEP